MSPSGDMDKNSNQLPKLIRDKLQMIAASCCYSILRQGQGKKNSELWTLMSNLYHRKDSTVSHTKLLSNLSYCFMEIYDVTTDTVVDKDTLHS